MCEMWLRLNEETTCIGNIEKETNARRARYEWWNHYYKLWNNRWIVEYFTYHHSSVRYSTISQAGVRSKYKLQAASLSPTLISYFIPRCISLQAETSRQLHPRVYSMRKNYSPIAIRDSCLAGKSLKIYIVCAGLGRIFAIIKRCIPTNHLIKYTFPAVSLKTLLPA